MPKRTHERVIGAADGKPGKIGVPLSFLRSRKLTDGAKLLWCYFRVMQIVVESPSRKYTFKALREAIGVCQASLRGYLKELVESGWLRMERVDLRTVTCHAVWAERGQYVFMPTDLLFDVCMPEPAKWLWGSIAGLKVSYTYRLLEQETGYCRESVTKYLKALREHGWLEGGTTRVNRRIQFEPGTANPMEAKREKDEAEFHRGRQQARYQSGYSEGQYLLAHKVRYLVPDITLLENAHPMGLINPETGGHLEVDLYLAEVGVALEFQGPQHYGLTELYSDPVALEKQQRRDELKRQLCREKGIPLLSIEAKDLDFKRLEELLSPYVQLRTDDKGRWHVRKMLEKAAADYRRRAARRLCLRPRTLSGAAPVSQ